MSDDTCPKTKDLYLIYFLVVLYAFCYQLQSPLEPFLVDRFVGKKGADSTTSYGQLQSFFSLLQVVGSLVMGNLLDRYGVRVGFVINFAACAAVYAILANTSSISMLFLSKVPGVAMAGFLCAQTAVSEVTAAGEDRVAALGRLTTAYTIGGVLGPYTGGLLGAGGDYFLGAKIAVAGSLVAIALSLLLSSRRPEQAGEAAGRGQSSEGRSGEDVSWRSKVGSVWQVAGFLISIKLLSSTANSMASSTQSLVLKNELGFSESDLGLFMSCQFAFGGVANGFLLAPLMRLLGGKPTGVVHKSLTMMAGGYLIQAFFRSDSVANSGLPVLSALPMDSPYCFVAVAMFLSVFQYCLSTSITAETTSLVPEEMKGTLIGMEHSIFSGARILTPSVGAKILGSQGAGSLYGACAALLAGTAALFASRGTVVPNHHKDR